MNTQQMIDFIRKRADDTPTMTRLQAGDIVDLGSPEGVCLIWRVNDCRAVYVPLNATQTAITLQAPQGISPNSPVKILKRLGKQGMIEFLETANNTNTMSKKDKTAKVETENEAEAKPRVGKLGGFLGFPVTAVVRTMSRAGWKFWEIKKVLTDEGITVADNTIRIQMSAGRNTEQPGAEISKKKLAELRPDPEDQPKAAKAEKSATKTTKATAARKKKDAEEDDAEDDTEDDAEEEAPKAKSKKPKVQKEEDEDAEDAEEGAEEDGDDDGDGDAEGEE